MQTCAGPRPSRGSEGRRRWRRRERRRPSVLPSTWSAQQACTGGNQRPQSIRPLLVLSSEAVSADGGYRSPRESKRRGPASGERQEGCGWSAAVCFPCGASIPRLGAVSGIGGQRQPDQELPECRRRSSERVGGPGCSMWTRHWSLGEGRRAWPEGSAPGSPAGPRSWRWR